MKKTITFSIAALTALSASAQLPVSTTAGKKQAVIEEFTGNTCGYCPDGHKISDQITSANPTKAFAVNIHAGSYANPASSSASKDFRTTDGNGIYNIPGHKVSGFPAGSVNRRPPTSGTPQMSGGWAMSRGSWAANVSTILNENTYINVAGQAYVHPTTRQMIVNMEAYYTAAAPAGTSRRITLALVQDDIVAYQGGASSYYPAMLQTPGDNNTYKHQNALRKTLTPATGEGMTGNTTAGTKWTKTYNYTVAADIPGGTKTIPVVLANLELVAYITDASTNGNIVAACKVPITITTSTDLFGPAAAADLITHVNVYPNPMANEGAAVFTLAKESNVTVEVVNALGQVVKSDKLGALSLGEHKYELDGTNLTNGIYFVNINVDGFITTKKISVLK